MILAQISEFFFLPLICGVALELRSRSGVKTILKVSAEQAWRAELIVNVFVVVAEAGFGIYFSM